ncbi:MAG: TolC family protein [Candidatus Omnitrophica bacterium]|nr:TolC family protein [Candidatus Omnitrophota bacterium]
MKFKRAAIILFLVAAYNPHCICAEDVAAKKGQEDKKNISISQGIQMVLSDNRLIKVTIPDNEMAYQDTLVSRSVLLPNLNVTAVKTYNRFQDKMKFGSDAFAVSDKDPFSFGVDVYQTLFDFGKSLSNYRASKELWKATQAHTESVKRVATLEFLIAYFNVLEAEKMIVVAQREMESLESYLKDTEHLYEQGVVVRNDLLPTKVRLADAKQKLIAARNDREVATARLNNILALPLRENIGLQDIQMQSPQLPEIEGAWKEAEVKRPEITFYSNSIKASFFSEKAKQVENLPVVFAEGGYTYNQNKYQVHEDNLSVNLGAKMNFYDGGAAKAEVLKERSLQKQLKEKKNKLIEDIKFEIEDSFFGLKNACEEVIVARDALEQAGENVRFYRVKYNNGSATPTDVLAAIALETKAQTNYFSADYGLKRNYAKLMYAMGQDLKSIYEKIEKEKQ